MIRYRRWFIVLVTLALVLGAGLGTAAAQGSSLVHVVQIGDTLSGIAFQYGTTVEALSTLNNIPFPYWIFPGQLITIPATGGPVAPAAPTTTTPIIHVVQSGENLFRIGLRYGFDVNVMAAANGLLNPNRIYIGQQLIVPAGAYIPVPVTPPAPVWHVVRTGETLSSIALDYGVTLSALMTANNLLNPNLVYIGQTLIIP